MRNFASSSLFCVILALLLTGCSVSSAFLVGAGAGLAMRDKLRRLQRRSAHARRLAQHWQKPATSQQVIVFLPADVREL